MPDSNPDLSAAIKLHLQASTAIEAAYTGIKILHEWPRGNDKIVVPPYKTLILIQTGRGGRGDIGLGLQEERVDLMCYGSNRIEAYNLWRKLDWYLLPKDRSRKTHFHYANTRVKVIARESGPLRLTDADAQDWPYCFAPYIFIYDGVPTS